MVSPYLHSEYNSWFIQFISLIFLIISPPPHWRYQLPTASVILDLSYLSMPMESPPATPQLTGAASMASTLEYDNLPPPPSPRLNDYITPHTSAPCSVPRLTHAPRKKLMYTSPMELMMLYLYVDEVNRGRKLDSGFQTSSHRHVAQELRKHFPEVEHLLDFTKVNSKLSQSFKKDYDTFVACKDASGFGWDDLTCEVTASDTVWEKFLESHSHAKKFQGTPFPEYRKLDIIFGSSAASGNASRSINQQVFQLQSAASGFTPSTDSSQSANKGGNLTDNMFYRNANTSPTSYLTRSHSKKDLVASAIDALVGYMETQLARVDQQPSTSTNLQQAMALYQEVHADEGSPRQTLDAIKVFKNNTNTQIFTSIKSKHMHDIWLQQEIKELYSNND